MKDGQTVGPGARMRTRKAVCERIRVVLHDETDVALAERLGVTVSSIRRWSRNEGWPSYVKAVDMAKRLGLDLDTLKVKP